MSTLTVSIIFFLVASFTGALGQYLYQSGVELASGWVGSWLPKPRLLSTVICCMAVMVLFVAASRKGGALTVLALIYGTASIRAALIALVACGTPIKSLNIAGLSMLVIGRYLMRN